MKSSEMTVEIKADTRDFDRAIRRAQSQIWWMKYGDLISYIAIALIVVAAFIMGVVLS